MQFMVTSQRRTEAFTDEDFDEVIPAETDRVRELYAEGVVRQMWLLGDRSGPNFVVEAADLDEVRAVGDGLPMAAAGLPACDVVPLQPHRDFGPR